MKKTLGLLFACILAFTAAGFFACAKKEEPVEVVNFADYETWNSGFSMINMMDGFGKISKSSEQAHSGKYSAKLQPLGSHTAPDEAPYFYYPMGIEGDSGYDYTDFTRLKSVRFYVYNAESEKVNLEFCIIASMSDVQNADRKAVKTCELAAGQWTEVVYTPDYETLNNICDIFNVAGIGFAFENRNSESLADAPVIYLDDIALEISGTPLVELETTEPAPMEIQSFDMPSSLVYVRLESGVDFAETYLAAGNEKLPAGAVGGVEFSIQEIDIGSWPRLRFDSRTSYDGLKNIDRLSLLAYFETDPQENIEQVELRMLPDTSSEYTLFVKANEWVKIEVDGKLIIDNYSDCIGLTSGGLFWVQNGSTSCMNAVTSVRIADIKGEYDEVRIDEPAEGKQGESYTLPDSSLVIGGNTFTADSWEYAVSYSDKALYEDKFGEITLTGKTFTPQVGGTYVLTYTATYGGKQYTASAEAEILRPAEREDGEIESFDDPSALGSVLLQSGTGMYFDETYLWAGDEKLPEGAKGGVEFKITSINGGSWPRLSVTSRATADEIKKYENVTLSVFISAPGYENQMWLKMFPWTDEYDLYINANKWVEVKISAEVFAGYLSRVASADYGLFWVQNGSQTCMNVIDFIRITDISACNEDGRPNPAQNEIESFDAAGSVNNVSISDVTSVSWDSADKAVVAAVDTDSDRWINVSISPRQKKDAYQALQEEGYNAVSVEVYLKGAEGNTARAVQMNYWAQNADLNASQGAIAVNKWVKLTFDMDAFLNALSPDNGYVKFFWVASTDSAKLSEIRIRNAVAVKAADVVDLSCEGADGFFLLESDNLTAAYTHYVLGAAEIPAGLPETLSGNAIKMSLNSNGENWPNFKITGDKNLYEGYNAVELTLYIKSNGTEPVKITQWPHGGDWVVTGTSLPVNQWVTLKFDAEVLKNVYGWSTSNGIEYSDLFWFTNAGGTLVSEIWVAGLRAVNDETVAFEDAGFSLSAAEVGTYEDNGTKAWFEIYNGKGYGYTFTISFNGETLEKGTDYTLGDKERSVTLIDPKAGEYTLTFTSCGNRFTSGSLTIKVNK